MFYTCSNSARVPAGVVASALEGVVYFEYCQDVVKMGNRHTKIDSISQVPIHYFTAHLALDLYGQYSVNHRGSGVTPIAQWVEQ